jgi:hypothetical protein
MPGHLSPPHFTLVSSDISRYPRLIVARNSPFFMLFPPLADKAKSQ